MLSTTSRKLRVLVHNCNRSTNAMHSLLDTASGKADLVLIQEPWISNQNTTVTHNSFRTLIPPPTPGRRTRVLSFVSKLNTSLRAEPRVDLLKDPDVQLLEISSPDIAPILLYNTYNQKAPPTEEPHGRADLRVLTNQDLTTRTILAGDFNAHHPWWNSIATENGTNAGLLVSIMERNEQILLNEPDVATYIKRNGSGTSVLDLVFYSPDLNMEVDEWAVEERETTGSDHMAMWFSITPTAITTLDSPFHPRLNWKKTDWDLFTKTLQDNFHTLKTTWTGLMSGADITRNLDTASEALTDMINDAATAASPPCNSSPRSKVWWNNEIRQSRTTMAGKLRQWRFSQTNEDFEAWKQARNTYYHAIRKAKSDKWIEFLQGAKGKDVFQVLRYTRPRKSEPTPAISQGNHTATTFEQKCRVFREAMFPEPPPTLPASPVAPEEVFQWKVITRSEIETAIFSSNPNKAPGPDGIPFLCLRHAWNAIPEAFVSLYSHLARRGYHPEAWRTSTTAIIPKPNKPAYDVAKAYRPVALLNCLGKILEKIMATRLSWLAEKHQILYRDQIGGRPQRSAIDAVMALVHLVEAANSQGKVASALFMDVKGAFDNVSAHRLQTTMTEMGLPVPLVAWVQSFLSDRRTSLSFDGKKEDMLPVRTGIPQGSPISPILFLIYLQPLFSYLETHHPGHFYPSYIDDVGITVVGRSEAQNARTLENIATTIMTWSDENALSFDGPKTELIHFKHRRNAPVNPLSITIGTNTIQPSSCLRWLGVWLDPRLTFRRHIKEKTAAATRAYFALRRLANTQNGLTVAAMRLLYISAVIPILDYGAEVWFKGDGQKGYIAELQKVQNKALRSLMGAFRTSPVAALKQKQPFHQQERASVTSPGNTPSELQHYQPPIPFGGSYLKPSRHTQTDAPPRMNSKCFAPGKPPETP